MDYVYIVNAFKQQQQQFLLQQEQLQQKLRGQTSAAHISSLRQQLENSDMSNSWIWQPWRDFQQAAVHHQLYAQHQQKLHFKQETRLTSKELPTTTWRRERRLRTSEYHHTQHHPAGFSSNNVGALSPSSSPSPNSYDQYSSNTSECASKKKTNLRSNNHHISIMMAATASVRPLNESPNHSQSSPPHSNMTNQIHLSQMSRSQVLQNINLIQNDDVPLDMSVNSLKQRNSPPPPYREPLPGSQFSSSIARPSVITQAPPKRDLKDSTLVTNRENDNRSCESIDEHFRRSLGNDYFSLFSKRSPTSQSTKTPSPQPHNSQLSTGYIRSQSPSLASSADSTLPQQTTISQSELNPPPAYTETLPNCINQKNSHQVHQNQTLTIPKANNVLLSTAAKAAPINMATGSNSPPLPLIVRSNVLQNPQHNVALQNSLSLTSITPTTSPISPSPNQSVNSHNAIQTPIYNSSSSRAASPISLHRQSSVVAVNLSTPPMDNSPSSSPRHTPPINNLQIPNTSSNLPVLMRIKTEPGLQNLKSNNSTTVTFPMSKINHNKVSTSTSTSSSIFSPSSPKTLGWKTNTCNNNTSAEVLASVDDHFAKALGDTWKKLQENKEICK